MSRPNHWFARCSSASPVSTSSSLRASAIGRPEEPEVDPNPTWPCAAGGAVLRSPSPAACAASRPIGGIAAKASAVSAPGARSRNPASRRAWAGAVRAAWRSRDESCRS